MKPWVFPLFVGMAVFGMATFKDYSWAREISTREKGLEACLTAGNYIYRPHAWTDGHVCISREQAAIDYCASVKGRVGTMMRQRFNVQCSPFGTLSKDVIDVPVQK